MRTILRIMCLLGIVDGFVLAFSPKTWFGFWVPIMDRIASSKKRAIFWGTLEITACLWLCRKLKRRRSHRKHGCHKHRKKKCDKE